MDKDINQGTEEYLTLTNGKLISADIAAELLAVAIAWKDADFLAGIDAEFGGDNFAAMLFDTEAAIASKNPQQLLDVVDAWAEFPLFKGSEPSEDSHDALEALLYRTVAVVEQAKRQS